MDFSTISGVVAGITLIVIAIVLGPTGVGAYLDLSSAMIVFGGSLAAILITYPPRLLAASISIASQAFFIKQTQPETLVKFFIDLAEIGKRQGIIALEAKVAGIKDKFLAKALQMAVDGYPLQSIKDILESEIASTEERHRQGAEIFSKLGGYAPSFGMVGTLIGLVGMLKNLKDPGSIGPNMAIALITTFYGALSAYVVFLPIAGKLNNKSLSEIALREMIVIGVLSIAAGDNSRIVEQKLGAFLSPTQRLKIHR